MTEIEKSQTDPRFSVEGRDLRNIDDLYEMLLAGKAGDLQAIQSFYQKDEKAIEFLRTMALLRKQTHNAIELENAQRAETRPKADAAELDLGTYMENIEPQVRPIVQQLYRKGYTTMSSGFDGVGEVQTINFDGEPLKNFEWPQDFVTRMSAQGVRLGVDPSNVWFQCARPMDLNELEKLWAQIENVLPDLQQQARPNPTPQAERFRHQQSRG